MTLLDAPKFDHARDRRNRRILIGTLSGILILFIGFWIGSGRPVDWPWNWPTYLVGRYRTNQFLVAVEKNQLEKAYGIWVHDPKWEEHPKKFHYPYKKFLDDWMPGSPDNDFGTINSHKIVAAKIHGNVLLMAILVNERKSHALNIIYDPHDHSLDFSPEDVYIYLGK